MYITAIDSENIVRLSLLEDSFTISGLMRISTANNDRIPGVNVSYK